MFVWATSPIRTKNCARQVCATIRLITTCCRGWRRKATTSTCSLTGSCTATATGCCRTMPSCSRERTPSTTPVKCWTRCKPIATEAGVSVTSAATAFIGRLHSRKSNPGCLRYAAPRVASVPGLPKQASTTTSLMASMVGFGGAMAARPRSWSGWASPRKALFRAPIIASTRRRVRFSGCVGARRHR